MHTKEQLMPVIENTGVNWMHALNKLYVAFKDPDRIAWEFYMK
jgi:hypothetical protein